MASVYDEDGSKRKRVKFSGQVEEQKRATSGKVTSDGPTALVFPR
jgi:hypothetical protein